MRDELVARGVPAMSSSSTRRATAPGIRSCGPATCSASGGSLIVSQRDHLARALFLARHIGIEAWGVAARGVTYGGFYARLIGDLASLVAYVDLMMRRPPRGCHRSRPGGASRQVAQLGHRRDHRFAGKMVVQVLFHQRVMRRWACSVPPPKCGVMTRLSRPSSSVPS